MATAEEMRKSDCLHCRLLQTILDFRAEKPDDQHSTRAGSMGAAILAAADVVVSCPGGDEAGELVASVITEFYPIVRERRRGVDAGRIPNVFMAERVEDRPNENGPSAGDAKPSPWGLN